MKYIFSAVSVCSNPCAGSFPRTNMSFFLLSMCAEELMPTSKINTFSPNSTPGNEKLDLLSSPIPQPEYPYLSILAFLVKITAPNKQSFSV